jgi:Nucleotidyl transferase AbiEii toxin, Type IV TA system
MHVLYGLQQVGLSFELKGETSLSKGFGIIDRFSEDIDILIHPPAEPQVNENPKNTKEGVVRGRRDFYEWLAANIQIDGIVRVERDLEFDDKDYFRSGGIRLYYTSYTTLLAGVKEGILLEVGFDDTSPNQPVTISSWAYDKAVTTPGIAIIDNRATGVVCYNFEYTFVEKLQTIATKFRRERFPAADRNISVALNQAFLPDDPAIRDDYRRRYERTAAIYNRGQPPFDELLARIKNYVDRL